MASYQIEMSCDDKDLLAAYVQRKDAEAFAVLVERYQSLVYATSLRHLRNGADAEDVAQDVFLSLARNAHQIVAGNLGGWLYRTSLNAANSKLRTDLSRAERERARAVPDQKPDAALEWRQIEEVLDVCLAELDSASRELVIQRFFVNRTQSELAESLGVDQATVSRRLRKAIDQLRRQMTKRGVSLTAAGLAAALTTHGSAANLPTGLTASLTKIGVAGVGKKISAVLPTQLGSLAWLITAVATVAVVIAVAVLVGTIVAGGGPTATVATLAAPPQNNLVALMTRIDYTRTISPSGLAIGSQGQVVAFNDTPGEIAGVFMVGANGRARQLIPLPPHRRRALALGTGAIAVVNWDGHVGVVDRTGWHALSDTGVVDSPPSINRQGWVAFLDTMPTSCIRLATGDGVRTLHQAGGRFAHFDEVSINDEGQVAFRAETAEGKTGLFVTDRGDVRTIAEVGDRFLDFQPWFDFNGEGQLAFVAGLEDGSEALMVGDGQRLRQIARSGKYFDSILQVALNSAGAVVFTARRAGEPDELPIADLFLWDGRRIVRLLNRGQLIRDETLEGVLLWRDSLNDAGQVSVVADVGPDRPSMILRLETAKLPPAE